MLYKKFFNSFVDLKRKNLNYKKVGYTYCKVFTGYKLFVSKNIEFKSVLVNIDYFDII